MKAAISASMWAPLCFMLLLILASTARADRLDYQRQWCIADEQTPDEVLQMALDWACGKGGANCSMIQQGQPCYLPSTIRDHASYAFNNYFQSFKNQGGSCYFNAAAIITESDPSHGSCRFEFVP